MSTFFATSGLAGANLDVTSVTQQFALGTRIAGNSGTTWVYVQADGAVDDNDVVSIDETFQATPVTIASAIDGGQLAVAQCAFADNEYGWVALNGGALTVAVSGTSTVSVAIYIGTVSGHLSTTASSATVAGIAIQTASSTSTGVSSTAIVSWPKCLLAGV